jgi:hypothetical protein
MKDNDLKFSQRSQVICFILKNFKITILLKKKLIKILKEKLFFLK